MIIYKLPCLIVFYCCHTHSLSASLSEDIISICREGHWVCQRCHPPLMTELLFLCSKLILCLERGDLEVIPSLAWEWGLWKTWREDPATLWEVWHLHRDLEGKEGLSKHRGAADGRARHSSQGSQSGKGREAREHQLPQWNPMDPASSTVGYVKVTHRIKCPEGGFKEWEERRHYL